MEHQFKVTFYFSVDTSSTEADVTSQEVAFIVAPMHVDDSTAEISLSAAATTSESSYVQVSVYYQLDKARKDDMIAWFD